MQSNQLMHEHVEGRTNIVMAERHLIWQKKTPKQNIAVISAFINSIVTNRLFFFLFLNCNSVWLWQYSHKVKVLLTFVAFLKIFVYNMEKIYIQPGTEANIKYIGIVNSMVVLYVCNM